MERNARVHMASIVTASPALEHVLQHGLVGLGQHPRLLQPLHAQQQRGKQNFGATDEQCVASPGPVSYFVLAVINLCSLPI